MTARGEAGEPAVLPPAGVSSASRPRGSLSTDSGASESKWVVQMDYIAHRTADITRMEKYRSEEVASAA